MLCTRNTIYSEVSAKRGRALLGWLISHGIRSQIAHLRRPRVCWVPSWDAEGCDGRVRKRAHQQVAFQNPGTDTDTDTDTDIGTGTGTDTGD